MNAKHTKLINLYMPGTRRTRRKRFGEKLAAWTGKCRVDVRLTVGDLFHWGNATYKMVGEKTGEWFAWGLLLFTTHEATEHTQKEE